MRRGQGYALWGLSCSDGDAGPLRAHWLVQCSTVSVRRAAAILLVGLRPVVHCWFVRHAHGAVGGVKAMLRLVTVQSAGSDVLRLAHQRSAAVTACPVSLLAVITTAPAGLNSLAKDIVGSC